MSAGASGPSPFGFSLSTASTILGKKSIAMKHTPSMTTASLTKKVSLLAPKVEEGDVLLVHEVPPEVLEEMYAWISGTKGLSGSGGSGSGAR